MHFDRIKIQRSLLPLILTFTALGLASCVSNAAGPIQKELPTVQLSVDQYKVTAEVANTDSSRQIGLMNRTEMATNTGMLFIFKRNETQCMWMKNTLIDLEVAFADENGAILNVEQMKAGTADIHCSSGNAKLALEMNSGWFSSRGLGFGSAMKLPDNIKTTAQ